MSSQVYTFDQLRAMITPLLLKYDMSSASIFGSYARGEADQDSDIDVLLVGNPGFNTFNIFGVAEDLYNLSGKNVDVFEISELKEGLFKDTILREAVQL